MMVSFDINQYLSSPNEMKVHIATNFPTHVFVTGDREGFTQAKGRFETLTDNYPRFIDLMPLILFEVCFFVINFHPLILTLAATSLSLHSYLS